MTQLNLTHTAAPKTTPPPRMTTARYAKSFLTKGTIQLYIFITAILTLAAVATFGVTLPMLVTALVTLVVLSFLEYAIHRFGYHTQFFFKHKLTARLWRNLHYWHHMNPNDPRSIMGWPQYTIPVVVLVTVPLGWLVAGAPGAGTAVAVGMLLLIAYEYAHGFAHMVAEPGSGYGRMIRRSHMLHHFHNETGNFGITSPVYDLMFGTYYRDPVDVERCPTVRNLGYTAEVARRYPWAGEGDTLHH